MNIGFALAPISIRVARLAKLVDSTARRNMLSFSHLLKSKRRLERLSGWNLPTLRSGNHSANLAQRCHHPLESIVTPPCDDL